MVDELNFADVTDFITQSTLSVTLSDEVLNTRLQTIVHGHASLKLLSYMHRIFAIIHRFAVVFLSSEN